MYWISIFFKVTCLVFFIMATKNEITKNQQHTIDTKQKDSFDSIVHFNEVLLRESRGVTEKPTKVSTASSYCSKESSKTCWNRFIEYPDKAIETFDGIPSNCKDLQLLGHQISGFYLVNGLDLKESKIETVYCEFKWNKGQKPNSKGPTKPDVEEIRFGYLDIHSSPRVFFYVQKTQSFTQENSTIPFERDIFNVGGAMKSETGIFTAPKTGTYYFSFVGIKNSYPTPLVVQLRKNNEIVGVTMGATKTGSYTKTLMSILKLNEGDTVDLYKTTGDLYDDSDGLYTHFTGWIIEEDLHIPNEGIETTQLMNENISVLSFPNNIPSNCQDLMRFGHKISGFFLVLGMEKNGGKLETIYCDFRQKKSMIDKQLENRVGYLDVYSSPRVIFYAQKNEPLTNQNSIISFEHAPLNVANALNFKSGIFTAPKSGVYHFSFSAMKDSTGVALVIYLRKNGVNVAQAFGDNETDTLTVALTSTLKLTEGDTIDLYKTSGNLLDDQQSSYTHFVGWIVEEDFKSLSEMVAFEKNSPNKNYKPYYPFSNYPDRIMSDNTLNEKPSNCQELQHFGHKLSGFYLVKGINNKSNEVDAIYCNFTQKKPVEKRYGYVNIHSSPRVFFYVQKNKSLSTINAIITFELETLNIGNAMNIKNGIFTVPKSGIYHFSFVAIKERDDKIHDWLVIYLRKNGKNIGQAFATGYAGSYTTALTSTLQLKKGDKIDLYKTTGELYDNEMGLHTHFTGWLIQEDSITL